MLGRRGDGRPRLVADRARAAPATHDRDRAHRRSRLVPPADVHPRAEAPQRAHQRRAEREVEDEVADRVGEVEAKAGSLDGEILRGGVVGEGEPGVEVERPARSRTPPGRADQRHRHARDRPSRRAPEQRPGDADQPPREHLPRCPRPLAEDDVGRDRGDRADREAGRAAERVAGDQHDVGRRLDVRERRERDPPERRERGQRRDERDGARRAGASARTRRSRRPARARAARRSASCQLTTRASAALRRSGLELSAIACPAVRMPRCPPRTRAVSVAKYQPPASSSARARRRARARPPAAPTRVANAAANSGSWVATSTAAPRSRAREQLAGELRLGARGPCRASARRGRARPASLAARRDDREREPLALAARAGRAGGARRAPSAPRARARPRRARRRHGRGSR